ncbi:MAG TPA: hypothetical protein VFV00_02810 [Acidimicrobiales bacterium]|nr:hypothetical protein [Acidimicrobiales bacterium]
MDRSPRLAELVVHLTGCNPAVAIDAVERSGSQTPESVDDALMIVARAMYTVQHVDLRDSVDLRESNEVRAR